jgi:hypothetical protein
VFSLFFRWWCAAERAQSGGLVVRYEDSPLRRDPFPCSLLSGRIARRAVLHVASVIPFCCSLALRSITEKTFVHGRKLSFFALKILQTDQA